MRCGHICGSSRLGCGIDSICSGGAHGDSRRAAAAAAGPPPELPELRRYEENKEFMEHLKRGVPPVELREFDLSSGAPLPRPVDIALGDMRPARDIRTFRR